ncbi:MULTISPECIES: hypothetical protein [unclassified Streptomyces]|uniref:hypothetical protein n=1 Tax=unclassified Streptomyces TaxID=2593676 RepID=UPI000B0928D7|nr:MULTISPECIES: hypothetical protein [unclassified Streptomyces]
MVEAARPFRAGTRFQALPDVRFLVDGGRIRAPGDLLPGPQDITAQRYGERLDHQMGGRGRLLVVEQPLILDHALWAQVRSLVAPLWERAGYPVLPVVTELVLGERITECDGPAHELRHSTLTWVLHGTVTATPRDAQAGPTLTAGAGDLLHWPAGQPRAPDEVFRAAVHGSRSARLDGRMPSHVQFMVERVQRDVSEDLLPATEDGSFDAYDTRLASRLDGRRHALVVNGFHTFDAALWSRERAFFAGLWDVVGLPLTGAITALFHGTYEHSPVGVHKDRFAA